MKEIQMFSGPHVNAALTRTIHGSFLEKIRVAGKEGEWWQE